MTSLVHRIGGLLQVGEPADFFASQRSRESLHKLGLTGAFALSCLPFLSWQHEAPITTWQQELWAFLAGLLMLTVLLRSQAWARPALSWALLGPASFAGLVLGQWCFGRVAAPSVAALTGIEMAWALGLMLAASALDRARLMRAIGQGLIAAGVIGGVLGLVQSAQIAALAGRSMFYAQNGLAYGFLAQRNLFADVQFMALLALAFVWPVPQGRLLRSARVLALGVTAASAALTSSNALVAQFVVALSLVPFWRRHDRALAHRLWQDLLLALAIMAMVYGLHVGSGGATHVAGVSVLRTLWAQAVHTIAQHPLAGIGLGNTPTVFYAFAAQLPDTPAWNAFHVQGWSQVHNLILQLWMEGGLAGLLIAMSLYAALALGWLRARSSAQIFAASILTVLLLHSLVEFPLWNLPFLGLAAICLVVILPSRSLRLPGPAALMPVMMAGLVAIAGVLALQMNARVASLQQAAAIAFNPTQIGTVASIARTLEDARAWTGVTGTLLEPAAVYETATFSPQIVPQQERVSYLAQIDMMMHLMPVGSIPYARADLMARLQSLPKGVVAMRQAFAAVPAPAQAWRELLSAQARRGDPVAQQLLRSLEPSQANAGGNP